MSDLSYLTRPPTTYLFDGCKLLWHQDKLQDWLSNKRITPIHIDMGIHKGCNIRCIYCYGIYQKPSTEYISEDRLLLLAKDAKEAGVRSLAIIGDGEPTMNKGLYPFVQMGKSIGLDMACATNGLLLTKEQVKILCQSLIWLRFNISAVNKYDEIMGAHNGIDKIRRVIKWAVKYGKQYGCTIGLQMVLIPQNFSEIIPLAVFAKAYGVDYLLIKQFSDPGSAIPVRFDMDEYKYAEESLKIAESLSDENTTVVAKWRAIHDTKAITKYKHWGFDRCIDLPFIFQISGNGDCFPCGYLFGHTPYVYGNVQTQRLTDILKSDRYWEVIKKVAETPLQQLCKGQCRHCETNKFVDRLIKEQGTLDERLIKLCGSKKQYIKHLENPPNHINFV